MDRNKLNNYVWGGPREWSFGGASDFESPYYSFDSFFKDNQVEDVIKICESFKEVDGTMSNEANTDKKYRSSEVRWVENNNKTKWIYDYIWSSATNTNGWNYTITGYVDLIQYTIYDSNKHNKPHYDWHKDNGVGHNHRKISFSILLNDDFEGGELELMGANFEPIKMKRNEAVMFPSNTFHRIHPVTKGIRKSLVVWIAGPKLK
jgi:PKHD-type hydroxylase